MEVGGASKERARSAPGWRSRRLLAGSSPSRSKSRPDLSSMLSHPSGDEENAERTVPVYTLDPLRDPRWPEFLERHSSASVFHSRGWLAALHRAYGYEPVAYTTSPPGAELTNGLVFCRIDSWLTGRRLVSLPFSDHSEPLVDGEKELHYLLDVLKRDLTRENWKYIEIRPVRKLVEGPACFEQGSTFYWHRMDL